MWIFDKESYSLFFGRASDKEVQFIVQLISTLFAIKFYLKLSPNMLP